MSCTNQLRLKITQKSALFLFTLKENGSNYNFHLPVLLVCVKVAYYMLPDIKILITIAKHAGDILLNFYSRDYTVTQKDNDPNVLVTTADIESEKYIIEQLKKSFPNCQIVSEEQENNAADWTKDIFLVDPLDGTRQFVAKTTNFSIMIGLCSHGQPTLGVVYLPALRELYFAEKGKGAFLEKDSKVIQLNVSTKTDLNTATVFEQEKHHKGFQSDILNALPSKKIYLDSATGYKICKIAQGDGDLFINTSQRTSKWDVCGPQIILEEAGGKLTTFSGSPIDYTKTSDKLEPKFFASNHFLHEQVINFISRHA